MPSLKAIAQHIESQYEEDMPSTQLISLLYFCNEKYKEKYGMALVDDNAAYSDTETLTEQELKHINETLEAFGGKSSCELTRMTEAHHSRV